MASNPLIQQGTLNRVRCSVVVPSNSALNITSPYMGQSFASISFAGPFSELIPTATGAVTSPEPYVLATISVGLLRTQALALAWLNQAQTQSDIGNVTIHSDTAAFPAITISTSVIQDIEPGAFDGKDPVVKLTLRGVFYTNSDLWQLV
jgi:hypothetical protein